MADSETPSGESETTEAPAGEIPAGAAGVSETAPTGSSSELPPLVPEPGAKTVRRRKRGTGRPRGRPPLTDAERAARADKKKISPARAKQRSKALDVAKAALNMSADAPPGDTTDAAITAQVETAAAVAAAPTDPMLVKMCGVGIDVIARYVPEDYGGGALDDEEKGLLGEVWANALVPYLSGPSSAFGIAIVGTVQIFAIRAMSKRGVGIPAAPLPPPPAADTAPAADAAPPQRIVTPAPSAQAAAPAKRAQAEPPKKRVRVPKYSGED